MLGVNIFRHSEKKGTTYSVEIIVIDVTLLKRTLDLLLRVLRKRVEAIDQFEILASRLPPVVKNGRCDATPVGNVNVSPNERSAADNETYQ